MSYLKAFQNNSVLVSCGFVLVLLVGVVVGRSSISVRSDSTLALRESGYQYISPLLMCQPDVSQSVDEDKALSQQILNYANAASEKDIAVYYLDLTDRVWSGVNINEKFSPASMLKVPAMVAILHYADSHPNILQKRIYYDGSFDLNQGEYFKPQQTIIPGHSYTVDDLLSYMIKYSDNNAKQLLDTEAIDPHDLAATYIDLGIAVPTDAGDIMSPETYSLFLRVLYNSTFLSRSMSQKALSLLSAPDFPQGITSGVPPSIIVAQKFGERELDRPDGTLIERELHDCGIIYYPGKPYILCVMTRGDNFDAQAKEISNISKLVYTEVNKH